MEIVLEKCGEVRTNLSSWEYAAGQITAGFCGKGGDQERKVLNQGQSRPRERTTALLSWGYSFQESGGSNKAHWKAFNLMFQLLCFG